MARKIIQWPKLTAGLPNNLPYEEKVSADIDRINRVLDKDPVLKAINRAVEKIPVIQEQTYPTPFGEYKTPEFYVPPLAPANFDGRQREAFKAAVLQDLAWAAGLIPGLSDFAEPILDAVNDTAQAKINDTLNPTELHYFQTYNKVEPSSAVAMVKTMVRVEKEP